MEAEVALKNDLTEFQSAVGKLSSAINKCGLKWKDEQFKGLSSSVGNIAKLSKQVLMSGRECEDAIRRFRRIESEK